MATHDSTRYTAAKARIDALGLIAVTDTEHAVYVVDPKIATLVCLAGDVNDLERWASELEAERSEEREAGAPSILIGNCSLFGKQ